MTKEEIEELRALSKGTPEKALLMIQSWLDLACVKADFKLLNQAYEIRIKDMGTWSPQLEITRHDVPIRVDLLSAFIRGEREFVVGALEIGVGPLFMQALYDQAIGDEEIRDLLTTLDNDCETYEIEAEDRDEE